jgi:hypothetical protein
MEDCELRATEAMMREGVRERRGGGIMIDNPDDTI